MKSLVCVALLAGGAAVAALETTDSAFNPADKKKPSITLRASPSAGFSPMRVVLTAELKGGDDDFAEFYCPTIEWIWGDDTRAESTADCEPYTPGTSKIQRRYTISHIFRTAGNPRVEFRLKQKDKVVGSGSTRLTVRPGLRDGGGFDRHP